MNAPAKKIVCPRCGESFSTAWKKCPVCFADLGATSPANAPARAPAAPKQRPFPSPPPQPEDPVRNVDFNLPEGKPAARGNSPARGTPPARGNAGAFKAPQPEEERSSWPPMAPSNIPFMNPQHQQPIPSPGQAPPVVPTTSEMALAVPSRHDEMSRNSRHSWASWAGQSTVIRRLAAAQQKELSNEPPTEAELNRIWNRLVVIVLGLGLTVCVIAIAVVLYMRETSPAVIAEKRLSDPRRHASDVATRLQWQTETLQQNDPTVADQALLEMAREGSPAFTQLVALLKTGRSEVQYRAARALLAMGPTAAPVIPALVDQLGSPDPVLRRTVAEALVGIGPESAAALSRSLDTQRSIGIRLEYMAVLAKLGPAASPAQPALLKALTNEPLTAGAVLALGKIGPTVIPAVKPLLASKDPRIQRAALAILKQQGAAAESSLAELRQTLFSPHPTVAEDVVGVLAQLGTPALPALIDGLSSPHSKVQEAASSALARIGAEAVAPVISVLSSKSGSARWYAARTLGLIGPQARSAEAALRKGQESGDETLKYYCTDALKKIH